MYYSVKQAAEKLGLSEYTTSQLCHSGALATLPGDPTKSRKFYKIDEKVLVAFKKQLKIEKQQAKQNGVAAPGVPEGFIPTKEACALSGLAEPTLHGRAKRGTLEKIKIGLNAYWRKSQLVKEEPPVTLGDIPTGIFIDHTKQLDQLETLIVARTASLDARMMTIEFAMEGIRKQIEDLVKGLGGL